MITVDKEYFSSPYYFFLRDKGKDYSLYVSVEETLTEARKKDVMIKVPKNKVDLVKKYIKTLVDKKGKKKTDDIKGEIEELVSVDGSMSNSKIPILDPRLHPRKTMDQTVATSSITNDPISRGYRTYYGESIEEGRLKRISFYDKNGSWFSSSDTLADVESHKKRFGDDITFSVEGHDGKFNSVSDFKKYLKSKEIIPTSSMFADSENARARVKEKRAKRKVDEVNMEDAFGYEETKDLNGKETYEYYKDKLDMEPEEAKDRTEQQGKDPSGKRDSKSKFKKDPNFISRQILPEIQKQKAIKMLEDMLAKKKNSDDADVNRKEPKKIDDLPLLVRRNAKALLKQAEKHGLSVKDLIKILQSE